MIIAHLELLLIVALVDCMPDNMCFTPISSPNAFVFLNSTQTETERACQVACGDDSRCSSYAFTGPSCTLLQGVNANVTCPALLTVQTKKSNGCPARTDPRAELGTDPCTSSFYSGDLRLNTSGICNRTRDYILRGVDEFGARVSLDNDASNVLTFNATRNMWRYKFPATGYTIWLVAVSCAVADATCPCASLPMLAAPINGSKPVQTDANGACANSSHKISFFGAKYKVTDSAATFNAAETSTMRITCKAGIWLLDYIDNHNGWAITNATCAPRLEGVVRRARSATRGGQPEEDEGNFDRRAWPLIPEGGLENVAGLPRIPRGSITLNDEYVRVEGKAIPRCVVIDAEDMLIRGTGFDRKRIGNLQFDPACLLSWMRYLLKSNFMVVAVCSPAYLTPMLTLRPDLLKMLAQYGLVDFPLELLDPRNTYRLLETAKRVGGVVLSTNKFEEHHEDPEIKELAESIIIAPDYEKTRLKEQEWFFKTRDSEHWLSYYCPTFLEGQFPEPPLIRGRLFCSKGHPAYDITSKYRKKLTDLRRDKLIAILDYAIMERVKAPCAFVKPQSLKASKLRGQLMKELEMQLSVKRWRAMLKDLKFQRARERAESEAKKEWAERMKQRAEAIEKRDAYREKEMERWRNRYKDRAEKKKKYMEEEVFAFVADFKLQVLSKLKKEMEKQPPPADIDYDALWRDELDIWQNSKKPPQWKEFVVSKSVVNLLPPIQKNPIEFVELYFKWYNRKLERLFREEKQIPIEELAQFRITQDFPPNREIVPFDRKQYFETGVFLVGRRSIRGGENWTRKEVDEGVFDDLRTGPLMSKQKYVSF